VAEVEDRILDLLGRGVGGAKKNSQRLDLVLRQEKTLKLKRVVVSRGIPDDAYQGGWWKRVKLGKLCVKGKGRRE